ncbi:hypothetical protein Cch01nite_28460 [Cellulomonas chitinilytica]|uniref:Uncharacterized protein n=1 Tax=Cellulomonas chitinilytica TaxID=398759 RepID=A0A919P2I8_9CELL|nr:hypothetical protein Cch01nite_28460 [Cellulomonas chitinilytica]
MNMPPRLSASQLFWWGLGLIALAIATSALMGKVNFLAASSGYSVVATLHSMSYTLGTGAFLASFIVRAVTREHDGTDELSD